MSDAAPALNPRLYFGQLNVLVVEANKLEGEIVANVLESFKVRSVTRRRTGAEAQAHLAQEPAELVIVGALGNEGKAGDEYDFIRSIRHGGSEASRAVPIILLAGHTPQRNVLRARDCGASFVVTKPIAPRVLYDRVVWLARDPRPFVAVGSYAGPDRRFHKLGPPASTEGRRQGDLSLEVGEATAPNLTQSQIDAMLGGKGAARP